VETFPNAPIQEAILDIFVRLPSSTTLEDLKTFGNPIALKYPETHERVSFSGGLQVKLGGESASSTSVKLMGYLFKSPTENKAVQARLDGFTFNKLRPYTKWTEFAKEARELWAMYREVAKPILIDRIGLRYLNRLELPLPIRDFRDYCLLFPNIPQQLPQQLNSFFMQYGCPIEQSKTAQAEITVTFGPPPPGKAIIPLILDVAVTDTCNYRPELDTPVWESFEALRKAKNAIFDASTSELAKSLFRTS